MSYLLPALTAGGQLDTAYRVFLQDHLSILAILRETWRDDNLGTMGRLGHLNEDFRTPA